MFTNDFKFKNKLNTEQSNDLYLNRDARIE